MATYRSNAMATKMPGSTAVKERMKYSWELQALNSISVELNQKMSSILGRVEVGRTRSVTVSMQSKYDMGTWRLGSIRTMNRMVKFPRTAMMCMAQKGMEIQTWASSSPGIPSRMKVEGLVKTVPLASNKV
ncbi:hypothetical protein Y1Q_0017292 [Alligator mississippiensis]|uniref:Uncharacterized protein n=1 Tax=Alligator mississippiensis TaxID=8496 RepID=A0A151NH81_ALLMI|nr:hypothetical protein Y1Q_0017292 [Alligator mississippiensis]